MRARLALAATLVALSAAPAAAQQAVPGVIAYERGGTVYVARTDGSGERAYAQGNAPALAQRDLAYVRREGGAMQLFVRTLDSGDPERQVTALPDQEATFGEGRYGATGAVWSPERTWLALRLMEGSTTTLAVVRADGSGYRRYEFGHLFGSTIAWRDESSLAVGTDEGLRLVATGGSVTPVNGAAQGDTPAFWTFRGLLVVNGTDGIAVVDPRAGTRRLVLAGATALDGNDTGALYATATEVGALSVLDGRRRRFADLPPGAQVLGGTGQVVAATFVELSNGGEPEVWWVTGGTLRKVATGSSVSLTSSVPLDAIPGGPAPAPSSPRARARSAPGPVNPPPGRSAFSDALPAAGDVSTDGRTVGVNLLVTLALMLLVTFPSVLFDSTLEEHYDEVRGWFHLPPRRAPVERPRRVRLLAFAAYVAVAAVLYTLLDSDAAFDGTTARLWLGLAVSIVAVTLVGSVASLAYHRRRSIRGYLRVLPGTLAVGAVCVLVSRLTDFEPGYLYGVVGGFAFAAALPERDEGRAALMSAAWTFAAALAAWLAWQPVNDVAARGHASLGIGLLDTTLSAIAVGGLEGLVLGLVPLRSLPGHRVWRWSRAAWAVAYGVVTFVFVHLLLHPASGDTHPAFTTWLALFAGFGVVSVAFWGYFQRRPAVSSG